MRFKFLMRAIAIVAILGLVGAACSKKKTPSGTPSATSGTSATPGTPGGSVTFGAEQWPICINPLTQCSSATWLYYTVWEYITPYLMVADPQGNLVASPLLTEAPTLDNGGLIQSPFTVTYHLNPDANWADGTPITSADIEFTRLAILNTTGTYNTAGYDQIESIDTTDPKTAVIVFKGIYTDWGDLFGGTYAVILEKSKFPDADAAKPDLKDEMQDSVDFSGGPWVLKSWSLEQAVFTRNDNWYGPTGPALFDQVTFVPREDLDTEITAVLSGEVSSIYPQPSDQSIQEQVAGDTNVKVDSGPGTYFEALWFQHESPRPLSDPAVREAFMYAVDRQAIIDTIIKKNQPDAEVLNCGFLSYPGIGPWCETTVFEGFTYDPAKSREILTAAGYDCTDEGKACTKDGKPLTLRYSTVSTNSRRITTQELLGESVLAAGFAFDIKNYEATTLFGEVAPHGQFDIADYASGGSLDPTVTSSFACDFIPTKENSYAGGNWNHWCNEDATALMRQSDTELDNVARLDLMNQIYAFEAQDFISLPLYDLPNVSVWRTDAIAGPIGTYTRSNLGLWFNMNEWYVATPA
jgi:peptide/nickel transport system substrate-binding protein